jgi:hypothetical protein
MISRSGFGVHGTSVSVNAMAYVRGGENEGVGVRVAIGSEYYNAGMQALALAWMVGA